MRPVILVVDDDADDLRSGLVLRLSDRAAVKVLHPSEVEPKDLGDAHLLLMDYKLDRWRERDRQRSVAFNIQTGLALATVLREVADKETPNRLTAVALYTGRLREASGRIRPPHLRHVVARLNNLEWVFEKADTDSFPQIVELAKAVQSIRGDWPADARASAGRAQELLNLPNEAEWFHRSWREVRECQPPIHELAGTSHGVLFLRWLLHQILPYPCFLWDIHAVAARLRIRAEDLERLIGSNRDLAQDLETRKYAGILAGFLGDRWWRSAVEDYAWELGGGSSGEPASFADRLRAKAGEDLELVEIRDPVVCLGEDFRPTEVASPEDSVRLRPDHWPAFADAAWMKIGTAEEDPSLRAMVEPLDQYRLAEDE